MATSHIRRPHAGGVSYNPRAVAAAYGCPVDQHDGSGVVIGVIELGGAYNASDMQAMGLGAVDVTVIGVDGATPRSDGPNGADGEVALDIQVIGAVAPGAKQKIFFAPNTDQGFLDAISQAVGQCDFVSISWGGPESSWSRQTVQAYSQVFAAARAKGVVVFAASGDAGSQDGTRSNVTDYPASDPSVVGCGGTKLLLNADGSRASEVTWDDSDTQSATGGGVSRFFPGRTVPDVAGNASPSTGYLVSADGQKFPIGGTSAVAPLYAAMCAVVKQAYGKPFDFSNVVAANPTICFDVTIGDNGGYRAGPGRDNVTGWGVVDMGKMLTVLQGVPSTPPPPPPTPIPPTADAVAILTQVATSLGQAVTGATSLQGQINAWLAANPPA